MVVVTASVSVVVVVGAAVVAVVEVVAWVVTGVLVVVVDGEAVVAGAVVAGEVELDTAEGAVSSDEESSPLLQAERNRAAVKQTAKNLKRTRMEIKPPDIGDF